MHQSIFSYNLSRPYPYQWFTWVVFLGGVVATVVFSLINLVADGYDIVSIYATNTTEIESPESTAWYQHRPWSLASKAVANCSAQMLDVGQSYYTNNYVFPYLLNRIWEPSSSGPTIAAFTTYKNDVLHDCVFIDLSIEWINPHFNVIADVNCSLTQGISRTFLILSTTFTLDDTGVSDSGSLNILPTQIFKSEATNPSLLWGNTLLRLFTTALMVNFATDSTNCSAIWELNYLTGDKNLTYTFGQSDDENGDVVPDFVGQMSIATWSNTTIIDVIDDQMILQSISVGEGPSYGVLNVTDPLGAAAVLMNEIQCNTLVDAQQLLKYYTAVLQFASTNSVFKDFYNQFQLGTSSISQTLNKMNGSQDTANAGLFSVNPAVFIQKYLCQVPRLKTAGSLVVTVIVADLVFLQALWKNLNWVTTAILEHRNPRARYCAGCAEETIDTEENMEMCERFCHEDSIHAADDATDLLRGHPG